MANATAKAGLIHNFKPTDHNLMQSKNSLEKAHQSPRCGAKAKTTGKPCQSPAMANGRCRMHGGKSTGATTGKANGNYKHGLKTKRHKRFKQITRILKKAVRQGDYGSADMLISEVEALLSVV
ncbi:MAG: HGGxSTG domain-containing protein [Methylococcaceae bacterium]